MLQVKKSNFIGKNGLLIPLDEVFESKFFVVEVRFMPTKAADIGNIIAAEPPGRGIEQMAYYSS